MLLHMSRKVETNRKRYRCAEKESLCVELLVDVEVHALLSQGSKNIIVNLIFRFQLIMIRHQLLHLTEVSLGKIPG
jgi:hypothetical protein